jgi:hypothetical protein
MEQSMSLRNTMNEISRLAREEKVRNEALEKKHGLSGLGLTLGDPASDAYAAEARHSGKPLEDYLGTLSLPELKKIVSLMYAGRDTSNFQDAGSLLQFHQDLEKAGVHDQDKNAYIRIVSEKSLALPHYFEAMLVRWQRGEIDPDSDLAEVI